MQRSACRPTSSARVSVRPLSSSTRWKSRGPSASAVPVNVLVYGFMRSAVEERGSSWRKTSRSRQVGTTFSMPTTEMRVSGSVRHMRPLPSDSTTTTVPVSATRKLAPETPTLARRNFSRRCRRAASASSAGVFVSPSGAGRPHDAIRSRKMSRIWSRLRWMAGTRMWEGSSSPSCTMSSARSVSYAVTPCSASASLRRISCVAIDLTLTTSVSPVALTRPATIAFASAASRAQWTVPPAAVTASSAWRR